MAFEKDANRGIGKVSCLNGGDGRMLLEQRRIRGMRICETLGHEGCDENGPGKEVP